ncbi:MAG: extracellular solute-binding protein [bacterium]|nr:extracellular solute-binding protein [bacterium]
MASIISNGLKSKLNFFIIFILISVLVLSGFQCTRQNRGKPIDIVVWNLWDDAASWKDMIASYEALIAADETKTPVKIVYYKKVLSGNENYENEFNNALSQGNGPDIIALNNSWMPRYKNKISPLDEGAKTAQTYQRKFVDVVSYDFLEGNNIYAVPLSMDTLALYYNVDILNAAGIFDPPRTWDEFNTAVKKLTMRDANGNIKRAGAAIGTDKNINRSSDILSLLMLQSGSSIVDDVQKKATFTDLVEGSSTREDEKRSIGGTAIQFYTDFANPAKTVYTWDPLMDYSIDAFYQMNAAMMINYAYTVPTVRSKAPKLKFAVSSMPQITGVTVPVNYANYWAMAVSAGSTHKAEAWDFLMYITNPEIAKTYLAKTAKPAAQRDLVSWQENGEDLNLAVFARQSLTAKSWYQKDNFAIETIFNDAINSVVLNRSTAENASELAASQLDQIMKEKIK